MDIKDVEPGFSDPDDYDFAIVHLTDTQYIAEGAADSSDPERQKRFRQAHDAIAQWIGQNAATRKIVYVAHTGDLVENWCWRWNRRSTAAREFKEADRFISMIEDYGVPVGVLPGNHDNRWGSDEGRGGPELSTFNKTFGPARTKRAQQKWAPIAGSLPVHVRYGGPWKNRENSCHYDLIDVGPCRMVVVHMGYGIKDAHVAWARHVLCRYKDRDAIVCTHHYLDHGMRPDGSQAPHGGPGSYGPDDGVKLYQEVVSKHANVVMVLCGHISGTGWRVDDAAGRQAMSLLADYQAHRVPDENFPTGYKESEGERRTGFLRLLQFRVEDRSVRISTYSPILDSFSPRDFAPDAQVNRLEKMRKDHDDSDEQWINPDHVIMSVDLQSHSPQGRIERNASEISQTNHDGDISGRVLPDPLGVAITLGGAVGVAVIVHKIRKAFR